ncbi:hypothetical protein PENANT_c004G10581 [Penicillium antarcticum]|uniref:SAP domain-containing protein n=1 Tax=Penicillium antarcticum TaxID=416450 RepID=A0A1V6QH08_9EURO|nr:uncharacterized protein N7508_002354 [Penicillium antarcticum]KAJ5317846.1 hypothetical protein N7508_002354 [Penicillium antarcticum]OQD88156.1 hypothetical protein PENANT_c004G10581 [Penicillium antarcticum]
MTDYSSWKVPELKAELKRRAVPQTGLRLKQQFIDKLLELDSQTDQGENGETAAPEETTDEQPSAPEPAAQAPEPEAEQPQIEQPKQPEQPEQPEELKDPIAEEKDTQASIAVSDKAYEETKGDPLAQAVIPAESQKVEHVAKPAEEVHTEKPLSPSGAQKSPVASQQMEVNEPTQVPQDASKEGSAKSEEKSTLSAPQTSGANTGVSTPLPTEEALEDTRKRKRRSQSPAPSQEEIANRKARAMEEAPRVLMTEEKETVGRDEVKPPSDRDTKQPTEASADAQTPHNKPSARFRDLFAPSDAALPPASGSEDVKMEDVDVEPARHAATAALYIEGLMRPLQPVALRKHLASLASAPGLPGSDTIIDFYLDSIKTHCFVSFTSVAAASRVRSAVHGTVWPNERNRKSLWADFIPHDKIKEWIQTEEASRDRAGPAPRWEVTYETTDNGTTATLAEAGSKQRPAPTQRDPGFNRTPPLGPRSSMPHIDRRPSDAPPAPSERPGQGFKPLDERFKSTTAKPKLYYLPVPRPIADKRLDQFDDLIEKGTFPRRGGDEMRRITFEDEDRFVDIGPERFGAPGPRPGMGRGRGRGGRRGDSWRA